MKLQKVNHSLKPTLKESLNHASCVWKVQLNYTLQGFCLNDQKLFVSE